MSKTIESLRQDHRNMQKLLDVIAVEFDLFKTGGTPDYELLHSALRYCLHYPELYHHPKEDAVYEQMRDRTPQALTGMGNLEKAHELLSDLVRRVMAMVQRIENEAEFSRPEVSSLMEEFLDGYRHHIAMEEDVFFPAAEACLTEADWAEVDDKIAHMMDPFQTATATDYQALRQMVVAWGSESPAHAN